MIAETIVVAAPLGAAYGTTGFLLARQGWTRLQGALWPATAVHRVYRKRHPLPVVLKGDALLRLEAEVGVGPYSVPMVRTAYLEMVRLVQTDKYAHCQRPFMDARDEYFRVMGEYFPAEKPIGMLVWDNGRSCLPIKPAPVKELENPFDEGIPESQGRGWTRVDDHQLMRQMATDLYQQYPVASLHGGLDRVLRSSTSKSKEAVEVAVSTLEWMQQLVAHSGPEGYERYKDLGEATERYNELREALAKSLKGGDSLMKTNATERLVRWCCRHHNPRIGWYFPQPGHLDFVPWKPDEKDWEGAFDSFL